METIQESNTDELSSDNNNKDKESKIISTAATKSTPTLVDGQTKTQTQTQDPTTIKGSIATITTGTSNIKSVSSSGANNVISSTSGSTNNAPMTIAAPSGPSTTTSNAGTISSRLRVYRATTSDKWVTRDIAALDFLLGIPLEAEQKLVYHGWCQQQQQLKSNDNNRITDNNNMRQRQQRGEVLGPDDDETDTDPTISTVTGTITTTGRNTNNNNPGTITHNTRGGRWWEKWVKGQDPNIGGYQSKWSKKLKGGFAGDMNNGGTIPEEEVELELPDADFAQDDSNSSVTQKQVLITNVPKELQQQAAAKISMPAYAPARRLDGDDAIKVQIPLTVDTVTRQRSIAKQAAIREWEIKVAHGLPGAITATTGRANQQQQQQPHPPMLDGRLFFSAAGSYPAGVFSLLRYEPKREEAALRRQKLEARGGGGSHFVMPARDWRGVSYRALLPRKADNRLNRAFNRFLKRDENDSSDEDNTISSSSSDSSDNDGDEENRQYVPGLLDDPEMVLGRHRNVMIGDRVTGCIVASTIQFVKPALLKADLNKQFRERFDGWEPPRSQRKLIGARVVDGVYTLLDPADEPEDDRGGSTNSVGSTNTSTGVSMTQRKRQGSVSSVGSASGGMGLDGSATGTGGESSGRKESNATIRMPPSLTLSKIRSVKRQALLAAVKAKLEVGTVALACVYFERLCLSCRVDKSNRRLCFASCLLLASKINEPNEVLVIKETSYSHESNKASQSKMRPTRLQSLIRPNKRSSSMFASLLEFFTEDWSLSLRNLFAAEWGVFAALNFELHATPSQVSFHFKRLMKTMEWDPLKYLGNEMYQQWTDALEDDEHRMRRRKKRKEMRRRRKEERLQRQLENEVLNKARRKSQSQRNLEIADNNLHTNPNNIDNHNMAISSIDVAVNNNNAVTGGEDSDVTPGIMRWNRSSLANNNNNNNNLNLSSRSSRSSLGGKKGLLHRFVKQQQQQHQHDVTITTSNTMGAGNNFNNNNGGSGPAHNNGSLCVIAPPTAAISSPNRGLGFVGSLRRSNSSSNVVTAASSSSSNNINSNSPSRLGIRHNHNRSLGGSGPFRLKNSPSMPSISTMHPAAAAGTNTNVNVSSGTGAVIIDILQPSDNENNNEYNNNMNNFEVASDEEGIQI